MLRKHGLGARTASYGAAARDSIQSLDTRGIAMVCICYLEVGGTPSHLRYLIRRLRQWSPQASILVGLWSQDEPVPQDGRMRTILGADLYAASLRDAVQACLDAAHPRAPAAGAGVARAA